MAKADDPYSRLETKDKTTWKVHACLNLIPSPHVKAVSDVANITGTNINVFLEANFRPIAQSDEGDVYLGGDWTHGKVQHVKVWVGGNVIEHWQPADGDLAETHSFRFASTKFADAATPDIVVWAKFKVWRNSPSYAEDFAEITLTLPTLVYNKFISLATVEVFDENQDPAQYLKAGDAGFSDPFSVVSTAANVAAEGRTALAGTSIKHAPVAGQGADTAWREDSGDHMLTEWMSYANVFFACTHGEPQSLWRSCFSDNLWYYSPNEVQSYVSSHLGNPRPARTKTDYTFAFFYACETLMNNTANPLAFTINHANPTPNKAYAGFPGKTFTLLYYPDTEFLNKHTEKLMTNLAAGWPFEIAMNMTQNSVGEPNGSSNYKRTKNWAGGPSKMLIKGDSYARLVNVYLSSSEWNSVSQEVKDSWFWVVS